MIQSYYRFEKIKIVSEFPVSSIFVDLERRAREYRARLSVLQRCVLRRYAYERALEAQVPIEVVNDIKATAERQNPINLDGMKDHLNRMDAHDPLYPLIDLQNQVIEWEIYVQRQSKRIALLREHQPGVAPIA